MWLIEQRTTAVIQWVFFLLKKFIPGNPSTVQVSQIFLPFPIPFRVKFFRELLKKLWLLPWFPFTPQIRRLPPTRLSTCSHYLFTSFSVRVSLTFPCQNSFVKSSDVSFFFALNLDLKNCIYLFKYSWFII